MDELRMIYGRIPLGADMPIDVDPLLLALVEYDDQCPLCGGPPCDEDKHRKNVPNPDPDVPTP